MIFTIVFPLVYSIGKSYKRREDAIDIIHQIKSYICNIYINQRIYNWQNKKNDEYYKRHYNNLIEIS
jgi:hypothetical protein